MSNIPASAVSELRARTGVAILACKEALEEANGDMDKAIEILRKRGMAQAVKKAGRDQSEGALFVATTDSKAALVSLKCETDFVGRSDAFIEFGTTLANVLLEQGHDAAQKKADELIPEAVQKLGENISLAGLQEIEAEKIGAYVHSNRKIAVVVGLDGKGSPDQAKDVAMHAAAMNPLYVSPDEVPAEAVTKEREIWNEQMKDEKKPAEILEKIMLGKEKKFREENSLLKQQFVKDNTKSVEQFLNGAGVTQYVRATV